MPTAFFVSQKPDPLVSRILPSNLPLFMPTTVEPGDTALSQLKLLIKREPEKPEPYYSVACIYAKMGKVDDSIRWLDLAIKKGFNNLSLISKDAALSNIHHTAYSKQLIQNH